MKGRISGWKGDERIRCFEMSGDGEFGEKGEDVVCGGVCGVVLG